MEDRTAAALSHFLAQAREQRERLGAGADPLEADIAVVLETRVFLAAAAGIDLPSDACLRVLSSKASSKAKRERQPRIDQQRLIGVVACLVEVLTFSGMFTAPDATAEVRRRLNDAGVRKPSGIRFTDPVIAACHEFVVRQATSGYRERDTFDELMLALKARHPGHAQWDRARLLAWVDERLGELSGER